MTLEYSYQDWCISQLAKSLGKDDDFTLAEKMKDTLDKYHGMVTGVFTDPRSFTTGYPLVPELISPSNLSQNISRTPTFTWDASSVTADPVSAFPEVL